MARAVISGRVAGSVTGGSSAQNPLFCRSLGASIPDASERKRSSRPSLARFGLEGQRRSLARPALMMAMSAGQPKVSGQPSRLRLKAPERNRSLGSWVANVCIATPICLRLLRHCVARAASRAAWTAGSSRAARIAIIEITTNSSIRVNPREWAEWGGCFRVRIGDLPDDQMQNHALAIGPKHRNRPVVRGGFGRHRLQTQRQCLRNIIANNLQRQSRRDRIICVFSKLHDSED